MSAYSKMTRIQLVGEAWDNYSPLRKVRLYAVVEKATGRTVYGPASWKACAAWKQGRPFTGEGIT